MKIKVNYDLLEKINESNKGFCLKRNIKHCFIVSLLSVPIVYIIKRDSNKFNNLVSNILLGYSIVFCINLLTYSVGRIVIKNSIKEFASDDLIELSNKLNINTDIENFKKVKLIKTSYSIKTNNRLPVIIQNKYLNINNKTINQEHIIGTNKYNISIVDKQKQLALKK